MNIYKLNYNANKPSTKQISVPTDSTYGVGVKWEKNGEIQELEPECYTMKIDGNVLSANDELYSGYATFSLSSDSEPKMEKAEIEVSDSGTIYKFDVIVNEVDNGIADKEKSNELEFTFGDGTTKTLKVLIAD